MPLGNDRSPTAWGDGRGEDSNVELFPSRSSLSVYSSADISPPPLSEILFLRRFEEEEVGRWSWQKKANVRPSDNLM